MKSKKFPGRIVQISGELRRRVNRAAHSEGLRQEIAARARIVRELHFLAAEGSGQTRSARISSWGLEPTKVEIERHFRAAA